MRAEKTHICRAVRNVCGPPIHHAARSSLSGSLERRNALMWSVAGPGNDPLNWPDTAVGQLQAIYIVKSCGTIVPSNGPITAVASRGTSSGLSKVDERMGTSKRGRMTLWRSASINLLEITIFYRVYSSVKKYISRNFKIVYIYNINLYSFKWNHNVLSLKNSASPNSSL